MKKLVLLIFLLLSFTVNSKPKKYEVLYCNSESLIKVIVYKKTSTIKIDNQVWNFPYKNYIFDYSDTTLKRIIIFVK